MRYNGIINKWSKIMDDDLTKKRLDEQRIKNEYYERKKRQRQAHAEYTKYRQLRAKYDIDEAIRKKNLIRNFPQALNERYTDKELGYTRVSDVWENVGRQRGLSRIEFAALMRQHGYEQYQIRQSWGDGTGGKDGKQTRRVWLRKPPEYVRSSPKRTSV